MATRIATENNMLRLKDIAVKMDCCERTAKRWWKRLRVPPDVIGHGPHRWHKASFERLISLWENYYKTHGTTLQLTRTKYAGKLTDKNQLELLTWRNNENHTGKRIHGSGGAPGRLGTRKTLSGVNGRGVPVRKK